MANDKKKTQTPEKKTSPVLYIVIIALFIGAYLAGHYYKTHYYETHKYDAFAKCLTSKNARMYGLYWCPHCADQKREFGSSFRYVQYIECASQNDPHQLTEVCKAAGVKLFPSWQIGSDPPKEGELTLQELSGKTGCTLP